MAEENQSEDRSKVHVDEDWKRAVEEEKERLRDAEQSERKPERAGPGAGQVPEVTLQAFLAGLYTQTLMALGELESPLTHRRERNDAEAGLLIDTIAMLQQKTEGNLTPEESSYVQNLLTDLRMRYVSPPAPASPAEAPAEQAEASAEQAEAPAEQAEPAGPGQ